MSSKIHRHFDICLTSITMNSFLFPEDLDGPSMQSTRQQAIVSTRRPVPAMKNKPPQMPNRAPPNIPEREISVLPPPTRAPPAIPQQHSSPPPPPAYAPPPIPDLQEKTTISIVTCATSDHEQDPKLQRTKSKRSYRQIASLSGFKEKREAKALARAQEAATRIEVVLPPLSPVVDDEFWRTGRYPTSPLSPLGSGLVHVAF